MAVERLEPAALCSRATRCWAGVPSGEQHGDWSFAQGQSVKKNDLRGEARHRLPWTSLAGPTRR